MLNLIKMSTKRPTGHYISYFSEPSLHHHRDAGLQGFKATEDFIIINWTGPKNWQQICCFSVITSDRNAAK